MDDKELIKKVLYNHSQYYLLYYGGSGGEFLSNLISKYSPKFRKINYSNHDESINRTHIALPLFFEYLSLIRSKNPEVDNTINELYNVFLLKNSDIKEVVDDAINFLNSDTKPPLLRCHMSISPYFNANNSYTILNDTEVWWDYVKKLVFLKAENLNFNVDSDNNLKNAFDYALSSSSNNEKTLKILYDAMNWIKANNVKLISAYHISMVMWKMPTSPSLTFEEIFFSSSVDLFKKYGNNTGDHFTNYEDVRSESLKRGNIIAYSKLFRKGYLEEMFDITSNEFHYELMSWHEKNLYLMNNNGFDISIYKI